MSLTLTDNTINKYLRFLFKIDNNSKKRLIIKLTESIKTKKEESFDLKSLFGAWEDSKDADDIIKEIRECQI